MSGKQFNLKNILSSSFPAKTLLSFLNRRLVSESSVELVTHLSQGLQEKGEYEKSGEILNYSEAPALKIR